MKNAVFIVDKDRLSAANWRVQSLDRVAHIRQFLTHSIAISTLDI